MKKPKSSSHTGDLFNNTTCPLLAKLDGSTMPTIGHNPEPFLPRDLLYSYNVISKLSRSSSRSFSEHLPSNACRHFCSRYIADNTVRVVSRMHCRLQPKHWDWVRSDSPTKGSDIFFTPRCFANSQRGHIRISSRQM
jgi:hypothetical protein